jgi:RNA polymerase sigma-70 factor, ECF subfamily
MTTQEFNKQLITLKEPLRNYALKLTLNMDDADDLLQDTQLKALSNKDKFSRDGSFRAWLYTIMKNIFINNYRRRNTPNARIESSEDPYQGSRESYMITADREFNVKEIERLIDTLNASYRNPFRMHIDGYKYKEIAKEENINIGTVKSRIFHARKKLESMMEEYR